MQLLEKKIIDQQAVSAHTNILTLKVQQVLKMWHEFNTINPLNYSSVVFYFVPIFITVKKQDSIGYRIGTRMQVDTWRKIENEIRAQKLQQNKKNIIYGWKMKLSTRSTAFPHCTTIRIFVTCHIIEVAWISCCSSIAPTLVNRKITVCPAIASVTSPSAWSWTKRMAAKVSL